MSFEVLPNSTPTFEIVSDKSDAALTASTPILTANAPAATVAAASAAPATLPTLPILSPKVSTSFVADLSDLLRPSTSPSMESLRVRLPAISHTPSQFC